MKHITEEQRKARNEQKKHQRINEKYAHTILFKDWDGFTELLPYCPPTKEGDSNIHIVCNTQGDKFIKHTITTEEITKEEADNYSEQQ